MTVRAIEKVNDIGGTLHIDGYLTGFSEAYQQDPSDFISTVAASNIPVLKESDKYVKYPRGWFWRDEAEVRPLGGRPVQVRYKVDSGQYLAEEWALEHTIDDRQRANTDAPIRLDENAVKLLTQKQLIRSDRKWCDAFFQSGVWTNEQTGGVDFTPFNDQNSDPIGVVDAAKERFMQSTGMSPNTLIMGVSVKTALRTNADIADRIKYTGIGVADNAKLAELFDIPTVRVARSVYNAAMETSALDGGEDFQFIANKNSMLLAYIEPNPGLDSATAIARFSWTGFIPGATNAYGGVITRGRDNRAYTDWFHSRTAYDMQQVSPDLGMFFENAVVPVSG